MFDFNADEASHLASRVVRGGRALFSTGKRTILRVVCLLAAVFIVPAIAAAQICPIQNAAGLPAQPGHPWTKLANCVSGGSAVIGGTVGGTDCTYAYVSQKQHEGLYYAADLSTITIQSGGTLVFLDQSYQVHVGSIVVENGGTLQIGAQGCAISKQNQINLYFTGSEGAVKGIDVKAGGTLRMWGRHGNTAFTNHVSWAHLAEPAGPESFSAAKGVAAPVTEAANALMIDKIVDWHVGDWIVVAGTDFSPDSGEIVQIQSVMPNSVTGHTAITLNQSLVEYHYGGKSPTCNPGDVYCGPSAKSFNDGKAKNYGVDERAEVGLLTRNIHLTSITPNPYQSTKGEWALVNPPPAGLHWGGEVLLESEFATAEIAGVEIEKFGGDEDGQFPVYFQGTGTNPPIISSNSIHHSYNKCIALAGLAGTPGNPITINDNVCARIVGNMFYLRTGAEQNLSFIHNLGVGAMSNAFTLNPDGNAPPPYQLWWAGDNLTNQPSAKCHQPGVFSGTYNCYDGLNITFTDDQSLPAVQSESYTSAGFWITNPANYFQANSIAGCQDQGIGFWYDLTPGNATVPLGIMQHGSLVGFTNNRAHGCYYGLNTPAQLSQGANYTPQNSQQLDLIAHFDGITATRNRYAGIWVRPNWYSLTNVRLAGNVQGASLVSAGGTEGSPPGEWSQISHGVFVGESMNNPERFGPCPYYTDGVIPHGDTAPPPPVCAETPGAAGLGIGYPDPKRNQLGYMFYDGPARIENSRFINFLINPSPLLTKKDAKFLSAYTAIEKMPCDSNTAFTYEGDAAMGWFQANVNSYPPTQYTDNLSFVNVDLRHEVYTQEVGVTCVSSTQVNFQDGDKNTVIRDHDATLSGYQVVDQAGTPIWGKFPISLNNLPFLAVADTTNNAMNTVDECYAEGAQDAHYESRPSAQMSPNDYATLEFSAVPCALEAGSYSGPCTNSNVITLTKDQQDYGQHQSMSLNGRNGNGIYEPKVMNGLGYTVQAQYEMPPFVSITYTDASTTPFQTRIGICYTTDQGPYQCPGGDCSGVFTVSKGVKTLAGPGSTSLAALAPYFTNYTVCNGLDNQYGYPSGWNFPNLALCLDPSLDASKSDDIPPTPTLLTQVSSIGALTPSTYFYDQTTGLLFLDVEQVNPNGDPSYKIQSGGTGGGPSPLGDCDGANPDPACPDFSAGYSFYSCPAGGCELYMVQVNPDVYAYDPTKVGMTCVPYPTYNQQYPADLNLLKNVATGVVLKPNDLTPTGTSGNFPHLVDSSGNPCPTTTPTPTP